MLNCNESAWFSVVVGASVKSAVLLAVAWFIAFLLRRRSAAARHLVWTAAAAAVLALPFLSFSLPAWPVRASAALANPGLVFQVFGIAAVERPAPSSPTGATTASAGNSSGRTDMKGWLFWIWAAGAAAGLLQMLVAYAALIRIRRAARPFPESPFPAGQSPRALAESLGIRHAVPVLEGASGAMPMTFGLFRPSVLLPAGSGEWSQERRNMVLLHELAHVRRGDVATHLMARTALSLNWWNPLAWTAWREFLKERERAADDLVLSSGARASEYASHLLEVARSMQSAPATACAAVTMARRSQLEGRLLAILDSGVNRKPAGRLAPLAAALLAVVLAAPFAAVRAQESAATIALPEVDATINAAVSQKNYDLLDRAAEAYSKLRKYDVAQTLLEKSLAIRGQVAGEQSAAYAVGLASLGDLAAKRPAAGDPITFYTRAVALGDRPEVVSALIHLGEDSTKKGERDQAMSFYQRALNADSNGPHASLALRRMAGLGPQQPGAVDEVAALYQRALAAARPDSAEAATTMDIYAMFLRKQNRASEAESLETRAKQIRQTRIAELTRQSAQTATVNKIGGGVSAPSVLSKSDPEYSEEARAAKFQGTVLLYVEIGPDGRAHNIKVNRGLGLGLDEKAIEAVSRWLFKPGMKDGQAVTVAATIEVNFRLL